VDRDELAHGTRGGVMEAERHPVRLPGAAAHPLVHDRDRWAQAETLGHIGDTRLGAGQPDEARAAWEEALAILDDLRHPGAGQVRARLAGLGAKPGT
jgi:hypothetical protein